MLKKNNHKLKVVVTNWSKNLVLINYDAGVQEYKYGYNKFLNSNGDCIEKSLRSI